MAKNGRGNKWKPTKEQLTQVNLYAGLGMTQEQCATLVDVHPSTFRAQPECKAAFEDGKARTIAKVAGNLVSKALKGDTTSAIFYLKTQAGWKETQALEFSRPEPLELVIEDAPEHLLLPPPDDDADG